MNPFLLYLLIGFGSGLIIFPIFLWLYLLIRTARMRRNIKKMMKANQFLTPIDTKDYDTKAWQNQKYGNIDVEVGMELLKTLNESIFKKKDEAVTEQSKENKDE